MANRHFIGPITLDNNGIIYIKNKFHVNTDMKLYKFIFNNRYIYYTIIIMIIIVLIYLYSYFRIGTHTSIDIHYIVNVQTMYSYGFGCLPNTVTKWEFPKYSGIFSHFYQTFISIPYQLFILTLKLPFVSSAPQRGDNLALVELRKLLYTYYPIRAGYKFSGLKAFLDSPVWLLYKKLVDLTEGRRIPRVMLFEIMLASDFAEKGRTQTFAPYSRKQFIQMGYSSCGRPGVYAASVYYYYRFYAYPFPYFTIMGIADNVIYSDIRNQLRYHIRVNEILFYNSHRFRRMLLYENLGSELKVVFLDDGRVNSSKYTYIFRYLPHLPIFNLTGPVNFTIYLPIYLPLRTFDNVVEFYLSDKLWRSLEIFTVSFKEFFFGNKGFQAYANIKLHKDFYYAEFFYPLIDQFQKIAKVVHQVGIIVYQDHIGVEGIQAIIVYLKSLNIWRLKDLTEPGNLYVVDTYLHLILAIFYISFWFGSIRAVQDLYDELVKKDFGLLEILGSSPVHVWRSRRVIYHMEMDYVNLLEWLYVGTAWEFRAGILRIVNVIVLFLTLLAFIGAAYFTEATWGLTQGLQYPSTDGLIRLPYVIIVYFLLPGWFVRIKYRIKLIFRRTTVMSHALFARGYGQLLLPMLFLLQLINPTPKQRHKVSQLKTYTMHMKHPEAYKTLMKLDRSTVSSDMYKEARYSKGGASRVPMDYESRTFKKYDFYPGEESYHSAYTHSPEAGDLNRRMAAYRRFTLQHIQIRFGRYRDDLMK